VRIPRATRPLRRPVLAGRSDVASTRAAAAPPSVALPQPDNTGHDRLSRAPGSISSFGEASRNCRPDERRRSRCRRGTLLLCLGELDGVRFRVRVAPATAALVEVRGCRAERGLFSGGIGEGSGTAARAAKLGRTVRARVRQRAAHAVGVTIGCVHGRAGLLAPRVFEAAGVHSVKP